MGGADFTSTTILKNSFREYFSRTSSRILFHPLILPLRKRWTHKTWEDVHSFVISTSLCGEYVWEHYPTVYGRSVNLVRKAKEEYDATLAKYDVLIMPTIGFGARRNPSPDVGPWEASQRTGSC